MEQETIDAQTGEIIEGLPVIAERNLPAIRDFQGIAQAPFDDKTAKTLTASIPDEMIELRPDGLIYLPQTEYRRILNNAFGVGAWALRPIDIKRINNTIIYDGELWANGRFISRAMGEQEYIESNKHTSWATAVEGAKSDCLTRCCKDIGIAIDLWSPREVKRWINKYAVKVWCDPNPKSNQKQGKFLWRRNDDPPIDTWPYVERKGGDQQTPPVPQTQPKQTETEKPDFSWMKDAMERFGKAKENLNLATNSDELYSAILKAHKREHANQIKSKPLADEILSKMREAYKYANFIRTVAEVRLPPEEFSAVIDSCELGDKFGLPWFADLKTLEATIGKVMNEFDKSIAKLNPQEGASLADLAESAKKRGKHPATATT